MTLEQQETETTPSNTFPALSAEAAAVGVVPTKAREAMAATASVGVAVEAEAQDWTAQAMGQAQAAQAEPGTFASNGSNPMTQKPGSNVVHLSIGDWFKILGVAGTLLGGLLGVYIHHDRMLTQLIIQQQYTNTRLDKIEAKLDAPNRS